MAPFFLASWANEIAVSQGSTTVSPGIHSAPWACFRSPGSLLYNSDKLISVQNETLAALHLCAMVGMICASKRKFINYFLMFFFIFLMQLQSMSQYIFLHWPQYLKLYTNYQRKQKNIYNCLSNSNRCAFEEGPCGI